MTQESPLVLKCLCLVPYTLTSLHLIPIQAASALTVPVCIVFCFFPRLIHRSSSSFTAPDLCNTRPLGPYIVLYVPTPLVSFFLAPVKDHAPASEGGPFSTDFHSACPSIRASCILFVPGFHLVFLPPIWPAADRSVYRHSRTPPDDVLFFSLDVQNFSCCHWGFPLSSARLPARVLRFFFLSKTWSCSVPSSHVVVFQAFQESVV